MKNNICVIGLRGLQPKCIISTCEEADQKDFSEGLRIICGLTSPPTDFVGVDMYPRRSFHVFQLLNPETRGPKQFHTRDNPTIQLVLRPNTWWNCKILVAMRSLGPRD